MTSAPNIINDLSKFEDNPDLVARIIEAVYQLPKDDLFIVIARINRYQEIRKALFKHYGPMELIKWDRKIAKKLN